MKKIALALMMICVCSLFLSFEKVFASTLNLPYTLPATINGIVYSDVLGVPSGDDWKVIYYTSDGNPYAYYDVGEVLKDSQNNRNPPSHYAYFLCVSGTCSLTPTDTLTYLVVGDWSTCFADYQTSKDLKQDGTWNYAGYKCGLYNVPDQTVLRTANISKSGARTIQLPETGQTKCFDSVGVEIPCAGTGQDGEIKAGVPWPNPRFFNNYEGTMTDKLTGLIWLKDGNCFGSTTWYNALDIVDKFNLNIENFTCQEYGQNKYNDWRLPNINELNSLINAQEEIPSDWLNLQGFNNVQYNWYWSSTTRAATAVSDPCGESAWNVSMMVGLVTSQGKNGEPLFVWPVRGGRPGGSDPNFPANVLQTGQGQDHSCIPGDDGSIRAGVSWGSDRMKNIEYGTITDQLTGLTWMQDATSPEINTCTISSMTWDNAIKYVKCLNSINHLGGGWRLPNRNELLSLVDYSRSYPALPLGNNFKLPDPNFHNVYWTSTTVRHQNYGNTIAWTVDPLYEGGAAGNWKDNRFNYRYLAWPVRGGQTGVGLLNLSFPLRNNPYTAYISSIFDHSGPFYKKDGGIITAFNGETGDIDYGGMCVDKNGKKTEINANNYLKKCSAPGSVAGYRQESRSPFLAGLVNYGDTYAYYDGHPGYDYPAALSSEIIAPENGTLCISTSITSRTNKNNIPWRDGNRCPYGNDLINGTNGKSTSWDGWHTFYLVHGVDDYTTWYLHSEKLEPTVMNRILTSGYADVVRGNPIAYVGHTGTGSNHLHFEVRKGGNIPVDPYGWEGSYADPYTRAVNQKLWQ